MKRILIFLIFGLILGIVISFGFLRIRSHYSSDASNSPDRVKIKDTNSTTISTPTSTQAVTVETLNIESSKSSKILFGTGQICGGIGKIPCPPGLVCEKEENDIDASGFCQKL
jgi:hypothetical protein